MMGQTGHRPRPNCFDEDDRIASPKRQLIAALADSGNPSQTRHNVKITFINFDFLKMNEYK